MALAPDDSPWYRRFRMLLGIYLIAVLFGVREFVVSRTNPPVDPETEEWSRMAEVIAKVNPADADTEYIFAMEALKNGDSEAFVEHMESALAKGVKHNDQLMLWYAQHLFTTGADYRRVNEWLTRWRINHPLSGEMLEVPLASGPADEASERWLRRELDAVDWILGYEFRPPDEESPSWRVLLRIRPATPIDIRDAVAAVSILALAPEMRGDFRVTCLTLEDCRRVER